MNKGMSEIVQGIAKIVVPFIMVFAIGLVFYGHITPGGGFSGGVLIAGGLLLKMLAFGKEEAFRTMPRGLAKSLECLGAIGFLSIALAGFAGGALFANILGKGGLFSLWSGGTIIFSNAMIGLKIGASLFLAIAVLSMSRLVHEGDRVEYSIESEEDE